MKYIPWYLKILFKLILSRLPFNYSFWQKIGLFRHGHMDKVDYTIKVFQKHIEHSKLNLDDLSGKSLLEIGPGDSIVSAILAASYGAKMVLIDVGHFVREDVSFYKQTVLELKNRGYNVPDITNCISISDILNEIDAKYYTNGVNSFAKLADNSIDLIFSQAVLEHVRKKDFTNLAAEIKRVLKVNAYSSHAVDLKDHLEYSLNNLRFPDKVWETEFFASSGFYTNRMSISEIKDIFIKEDLQVNIVNKVSWKKLPLKRNKFSIQFQNRSNEDLLVSEFDIITQKI